MHTTTLQREAAAALGFGASVLGGDLSKAAQRTLVEAAFDAGFRYFDVAPPYGHGGAERVLGEVLATVRDQVTLATKVGILHPGPSEAMALARRLLRPLKAAAPRLWGRAAVRARKTSAPRGRFSAVDVETTVHESLRRLRTTRVEHLLLHEAGAADVDAALLTVLDGLQRSGIVGAIGLGTGVEATAEILVRHPGRFTTAQVDHYWGAFGASTWNSSVQLVTHRCLRSGFALADAPMLQAAVSRHAHGAELLRMLNDRDLRPELLLKAGLRAQPAGRLLVSSSDPARIRRFARWASDGELADEARALNECLQSIARPGTTLRFVA